MSAVQDPTTTTTAAPPAEVIVDQVMTEPTPAVQETTPVVSEPIPAATATTTEATKPEETVAAPLATEEKVEEPVVPATEAKIAEPIIEGQLGYKAPGLLKQFTFSKKEFWLNDSAVTPQNLGLYLRGEKSEVSHPVTAWASQTGKGLLFFNKKGESDRTQPAGVIALYDATDLKKASPHEFTFEISGHKHSFKANSDAERDGWYQSIEKSIELGKVSKESVRDSEGYKAEIEKLNAPHVAGGAVAAAKTGASQPKKSTEVDSAEPKRIGSSDGEDEELKKKTKSRSTSRGMLNKLKGKKEEHDVKKEEEKEEKAVDKELQKTDDETVVPVAAPVTTEAPAFQPTTIMPIAAEEKPVEALPVAPVAAAEPTATEEKPKVSKRGSIFGRIPSAWGSLKSPTKEKELDLKPEVPAKDAAVSDAAPQLPETTTTEPIETPVAAPVTDATTPAITEPTAEATKTETATPSKEKKNFLSGLSFMNKRERSTSPSAAKEHKTETAAPVVPAKDEVVATEPVKVEEPATEVAPVVAPTTTEAVEEPKASEATSPTGTPTANKRQSMLGNLGRRASKALNRIQPKKENTAPTTDKTVEEDAAAPVVADKKVDEPVVSDPETVAARAVGAPVTESTGNAITTEENKPETVGVNPSTQVTASA